MRQEPNGARCRTLAALGIWSSIVEITIDVENMNIFPRHARQRLSRSDNHATIAADQQRNMPRLLQVGQDTSTDTIPGDPRARPAPDRRDRVMGKIAGNHDVTLIDRFAASRFSIERSRKGRASTAGRHCQIILTGNFLLRTSSDLPQPVIPARIVEQRPRPGIFPNPVFLVVEIPARQLPLLYRPRTPFHV